jgi:hypothetical protein
VGGGAQPRSRRRGNGEGEKKGGAGVGAPVLTGTGGMEQRRRVWPGVVPRSEEVGDRGA